MADHSEYPSSGPMTESAPVPPSSAYQFIVGLVMIAALMGVAVAVGRWEAKAAAPAAPAAAAPAAAPAAETPAAPPPTETLAAEVKAIKAQLEGLSAQVKETQGKIEALPKPAPAPDLKPIQGKVDELSKSVATLLPLAEKAGHLDSLSKQLEGLSTEVSALKNAAAKPPAPKPDATPAPKPDTPKPGQASDEATPAFEEAVALFKKAKYKDALDKFRTLAESDVKDARVWYFAALSSGLATANWTGGEALTFVKKGVELEKAGSPATDKVDSVFSDLTAQTGKGWLAFYRKSAK